jgi:hypothetical protein
MVLSRESGSLTIQRNAFSFALAMREIERARSRVAMIHTQTSAPSGARVSVA